MVFKRCHLHGLVPVLGPVILTAACTAQAPTGAPAAAQPASPSVPAQPGIKWTDQQLQSAVAPVRAGRKLTPASWPNRAKIAVCLSFDVDNESFTLARGTTAPAVLSAGEFGAMAGLPRVLDVLDRNQIAASFYIPAVSAMLHPQMVQEIVKRGRHEVGVHGWIHENLPELNDAAEEERLMNQAIDYLTKVTGARPVGYRAPSWAFSQYTMGLIRKAGFTYDSSLMAMDEPYRAHGGRSAHGADRAARRMDLGRRSVLWVGRIAAVTGSDLSRVQGRVRSGLSGRHDADAHDAPACHRTSLTHRAFGKPHCLHEDQARRLVRDSSADRVRG